jgi:uncharacterized protein (TIGR02118 family)
MYRLSVLYGVPNDPIAFDSYYRNIHVPLARQMHGLSRWTITRLLDPGNDPNRPYHLIADLYTPDQQAMERILASPEGQAARDDVANFANGGAVFLGGYEEEIDLG